MSNGISTGPPATQGPILLFSQWAPKYKSLLPTESTTRTLTFGANSKQQIIPLAAPPRYRRQYPHQFPREPSYRLCQCIHLATYRSPIHQVWQLHCRRFREQRQHMKAPFDPNEPIKALYYTQLEAAIKFADATGTLYSANQLVTTAYNFVFKMDLYTDMCHDWHSCPTVKKT
jgi:hypothetical protein